MRSGSKACLPLTPLQLRLTSSVGEKNSTTRFLAKFPTEQLLALSSKIRSSWIEDCTPCGIGAVDGFVGVYTGAVDSFGKLCSTTGDRKTVTLFLQDEHVCWAAINESTLRDSSTISSLKDGPRSIEKLSSSMSGKSVASSSSMCGSTGGSGVLTGIAGEMLQTLLGLATRITVAALCKRKNNWALKFEWLLKEFRNQLFTEISFERNRSQHKQSVKMSTVTKKCCMESHQKSTLFRIPSAQ